MSQTGEAEKERPVPKDYPKEKARQGETVLNTPVKIGIFAACAIAALVVYVIATSLAG